MRSGADPLISDPSAEDEVGTAPGESAALLEVDDVSLTLAGRRILDHVSFSLDPGEFCGLIGANGAGKTTLLRVILGLLRPSSGRVGIKRAARGRHDTPVGYVPQKIALDPDTPLRARDLVALGIDGNRFGFPRPSARRRRQVDEMLDAVGARSFAESRIGNLSGGEQQRVMIAHALIARPRLLLLDEPLANLDIRAAGEVVDLLHTIASEQDVAILLSAHDMNPLLPVIDHIVYLADGRAASGTAVEVVRTETLSRLYGHRVEVLHVGDRVLVVSGTEHQAHHVGEEDPHLL